MELTKQNIDFLLQVLGQVNITGKDNMVILLSLITKFEKEKNKEQ